MLNGYAVILAVGLKYENVSPASRCPHSAPRSMFDNDVFISFTHVDNQPYGTDPDGWISRFHKGLEIQLSLLRKDPRIWRDLKL